MKIQPDQRVCLFKLGQVVDLGGDLGGSEQKKNKQNKHRFLYSDNKIKKSHKIVSF